jgi:protein O-mannosyl-transferase
LNAFHVFHPARSVFDVRVAAAFLFLVCFVAALLFSWRRHPVPSFAALWSLITLIPVLNLQGVGENVLAERYLYIPSVGLLLFVSWIVADLLRRMPQRQMTLTATVAVCVISTVSIAQIRSRAIDWQNDLTLFGSTLRMSPDAALIHNSMGQLRLDAGEFDAAEREYNAALQAATGQQNTTQIANAYLGLASTAWHRGEAQRGLQLADTGLQFAPGLASLQIARGILLLQLGRMSEAKAGLERAARLSPYDEVTLNALGAIAIAEKNYTAALEYFRRCVSVDPNFSSGYNNIGRSYLEMGRLPDAIPNFKRAVELEPGNPTFLNNYGIALLRSGDAANARIEFQRVLAIEPNNPTARGELSRLGTQP